MAVNLATKNTADIYPIEGIQLVTAKAGIKKANHTDLTAVLLDQGCTVAGVFTQNRFCAAPVIISKKHLNSGTDIRALVINTGNANAGTGEAGRLAALSVCDALASQYDHQSNQILPFSTGVILEPLPVDKIIKAIPSFQAASWLDAAAAIMTTDTQPKAASTKVMISGEEISITGISKGSGMICPNMATMLGFVATDAAITKSVLETLIKEVADESFNAITVDGDTSTNDSFILIATGKSDLPIIDSVDSEAYALIKKALSHVALELAQAIIRDGEGATKFITINVSGGRSKQEVKQVAYAIAHSPLVKTAFFASDPNLGRLVCAIGYAGVQDLDVDKVKLYLDDVLVVENGGRAISYQEADGVRVMAKSEISVNVQLNRGSYETTVYTCDFSYDYVKINADYRS